MIQNNGHTRRYRGFLPLLLLVQAGFIIIREEEALQGFLVTYSTNSLGQTRYLTESTFPRIVLLEIDDVPKERVIIVDTVAVKELNEIRQEDRKEDEGEEKCIPKAWQTSSHPNCNEMHSLSMGDLLKEATSRHRSPPRGLFRFFGNGGNRLAGKLAIGDDVVVYKTGRYHLDYNDETFDFNRKESVVMKMLPGTTPAIYGYCGMQSITELADGGSLHRIKQEKELTPPKMLQYAVDLSRLVADMHSIDEDYVSLIHQDVEASNIVFVGGDKPKIIDFHSSLLIQWNATANQPCLLYIMASIRRADTLPPEIIRDDVVTEKVDVYSLGALFFYILTKGARLYHCERPKGICNFDSKENTITEQELMALKFNGTQPTLPNEIEQSEDPAISAIRSVMRRALHGDPKQRPSAKDMVVELERIQPSLSNNTRPQPSDREKRPSSEVVGATKPVRPSPTDDEAIIVQQGAFLIPLLSSDEFLNVGDVVSPPNAEVYLEMHNGGRLCFYEGSAGRSQQLWCSQEGESEVNGDNGLYYAKIQSDGNLVVREGSLRKPGQGVRWASKSGEHNAKEYFLALENAEYLSIYQGSPERPGARIWSASIEPMFDPPENDVLPASFRRNVIQLS